METESAKRTIPFNDERVWSVAVLELTGATVFAAGTTSGTALYNVDGVQIAHAVSSTVFTVAAVQGMDSLLCGRRNGRVEILSLPELSEPMLTLDL